MKVNSDIMQNFIENNGMCYPYNEIRRTRQGFHTKWLILSCSNHGVLFRKNHYFALHTGTLDFDKTQELIVSRKGLPLCPYCSEILDCMEFWGRTISPTWYSEVLQRMVSMMESADSSSNVQLSRFNIFRDIIELRVNDMLHPDLFYNQADRDSYYVHWSLSFDEAYSHNICFFDICVDSFRVINRCLEHNSSMQI